MFLQVRGMTLSIKINNSIYEMTMGLKQNVYLQGRVIIVWLSWLVGGICGVVILLVIICYCRLMPRHQKSFGKNDFICL